MDYNISKDLQSIREALGYSQEEIAKQLNLSKISIARIEGGEKNQDEETLETIYGFAYGKGIKLNQIKEMFYREEATNETLVFHGSKTEIEGDVSPARGRERNDFGRGFYCGESYEQAASYVAKYPSSSVYVFSFKEEGLKKAEFNVDQEWMLAIAYFRGTLNQHRDHPAIQRIIKKVKEADYVYAPIADNRMFTIIDQFIEGLITDEQCKHCLAATELGKQYVLLTDKAASKLTPLERCYLSEKERHHHEAIREAEINDGDNKVKMALIKYKREGKYIEEILG